MAILEYLVNEYNFNESELIKYINSAPYRYKKYEIPKVNQRGYRQISQPTKELKFLQRIVVNKFLIDKLPIHNCATAYRKGTGIKDNARAHVGKKYFLKMDFKEFFPSIRPSDFSKHINLHIKDDFSCDEIKLLNSLFFHRPLRKKSNVLSIGAPSSPFISNTIMYQFDEIVHNQCVRDGVIYTRYADDLTFSTNHKNMLFEYTKIINSVLQRLNWPTLTLNNSKTVFLSHKFNVRITGLVLTSDGVISVGRANKRKIKTLVYKFSKNMLIDDDLNYLSGYLSFCRDVEPNFISSLERIYGVDVIDKINRYFNKRSVT